jgi:hypothetical protein
VAERLAWLARLLRYQADHCDRLGSPFQRVNQALLLTGNLIRDDGAVSHRNGEDR